MNALYRNNGNTNNWLDVSCEGRVWNRQASAQKIRVRTTIGTNDLWQLRQITASENIAHFGLGGATNLPLVRVEWPSGIVEEITNASPRRLLKIREPCSLSIEAEKSGSTVSMLLTGAAGAAYRIDSSSDCFTWTPWKMLTNSARIEVFESIPTREPALHFYRAIEQE